MRTRKENEDLKVAYETLWLAERLTIKWKKSGLSKRKFLASIRLDKENGEVHVSYLLNGKRGLSFPKAVRLATAAGINLRELQLEIMK